MMKTADKTPLREEGNVLTIESSLRDRLPSCQGGVLQKERETAEDRKKRAAEEKRKRIAEAIKSVEDTASNVIGVIGQTEEKNVLLWVKGKAFVHSVRELTRLDLMKYVELPDMEGIDPYDVLRDSILKKCRELAVVEAEERIGQGVWRFDGAWYIVSGKEVLKVERANGDVKTEFVKTPVINGMLVHLSRKAWIDLNRLEKMFDAGTQDIGISLKETFDKLLAHVGQWHWRTEEMAEHVTAFLMLSVFQQAMTWRPFLYIVGSSNCGKSFFVGECLERIFGDLVSASSNATAHSIAQELEGNCKIGISDEFERSEKIGAILNLLKISSRGGEYKRGTTGKKARSIHLHHMYWMLSIVSPTALLHDASKANRVIKFELLPPNLQTKFSHLTEEEASDLRTRIVRDVLLSWDEIETLAKKIKENSGEHIQRCVKDEGLDLEPRAIENCMFSMSLVKKCLGTHKEFPLFITGKVATDDKNILSLVMDSVVEVREAKNSFKIRVIDLVRIANKEHVEPYSSSTDEHLSPTRALHHLRLRGMSLGVHGVAPYVFFRCEEIRKGILRDNEELQRLNLEEFLSRVPGALQNKTVWWGSSSQKALAIPLERCLGE